MFPWNMLSNKNSQFNDWMKKLNDSGMEQQLDKIFSKFSNAENTNSESKCKSDEIFIFESREFVFIKFNVEKSKLSELKVRYSYNKLFIDGLTAENIVHVLPAVVRKKDASFYYQDGVLEIKLPKLIDQPLTEIDLTSI